MMSNARSLLCAVPQPVADERKSGRRRFLHLTLTAGLLLGLQGLVAGPAAVATLPSALLARPVAASAAQPVMTGSIRAWWSLVWMIRSVYTSSPAA